VYLLSQGQITQPTIVIIGQIVTVFRDELDKDHYDALLSVQEKQRLSTFDEVCFVDNLG
jgi:hypothetical protein